jgi:hypothetical protein
MEELEFEFMGDLDLNDQELRKEPVGFTASEPQL